MQNDMIDVRDDMGRLLCRISADRRTVVIKHKGEPAYEVEVAAERPVARRAVVARRTTIVRAYDLIGIDNNGKI
jgi:hypothetical protein